MTTPSNTINNVAQGNAVRHGARAFGLLIVASSMTALTLTAISALESGLGA
ncbi:unannotated protein [freshwater metagenome]|uniref:Unannotated protein n=1 Tax=freshwater metagenome TaxID=449393 RepID=A0A6J6HWY4_9ZZZZ|nr:hypothetical protein [Actinomycetota bacterium]